LYGVSWYLLTCADKLIWLRDPILKDEVALFKVLADSTRLRLGVLLAIRGETCVCFLAQALGEPDCKISRHLGIMRAAGVVKTRRKGTWIYYKLVEPRHRLERCLQGCFRDCFSGNKTVKADLNRLAKSTCVRRRVSK
jgi:DNA-binding transcriptional ArsR family regulator